MEGPVYSNSGPQQQGPTLGQVAQTAQGDSANSYLHQYEQALQTTRQMIAPLKKEVGPPPGGPGLLANIATFGMAGLAHHDYMERERQKDDAQNRQLELVAMGAAKDLVDSHANAEALQNKSVLEQLGLQLRMLQYQETLREHQHQDFHNDWTDARNSTVPMSNTPEGLGMQSDLGLTPSSRFPGRLERGANGGWEAPAAGSPIANALGGTGGSNGSVGGSGDTGTGGGSLADVAQKGIERKAKATADVATAKETATSNLELDRNAKLFEEWLTNPKYDMATAQTLLSGPMSSVAGPINAYLKRKGGKEGIQYLGLAKTKILPALRAMEAGTKGMTLRGGKTLEQVGLTAPLEALANGSASKQEADAFRATALDALKQIREQMGAPQQQPGPTTSTATTGGQLGTSRRLSSGKLIMEEP